MSSRLLSSGAGPLARRITLTTSRRLLHHHKLGAGGLLRSPAANQLTKRPWPLGASAIHNVPATRAISFVRIIPNLFLKLVRIPAMFGGAIVGGLVYVQYQAQQAGSYAIDVFKKTGDAALSTTNALWQRVDDVFDQTRRGWQRTKENTEVPLWLQNIMAGESHGRSSGNNGEGGPGGSPKQSSSGSAAAAGTATAAAFGLTSDAEDTRSTEGAFRDDQMMLLTKKMIEIRNLLQNVGQSEALTLPSIVVIGSQSSGKSSVLEAIVGHEFLPKGSNMVTRRPIELTLVNTPNAKAEYGEFPALGLGKITDFSQIQKTLTDLNLAVPEKDCVSDDPIQLRIYSPQVPDLSLIDLPGYIQLSGMDQPDELKQKIADLCDKYIKAPNIILAISAADVDLANSTSLRASRKIDPRGERTIGVITKMDLVDADKGASMLTDRKYPLKLGYVGVVCKTPQVKGLFNRGSGNITAAITNAEHAYFSAHSSEFGDSERTTVGTSNLRKKLMRVLEQTMAASLAGTSNAIHQELAEATYEFKVQYNDRPLNAESYLAESLDAFKHSFKGFSERFGRTEVSELVKHELNQQVLNLLAQRYWNKPIADLGPPLPETESLSDLPKTDPENPLWHLKLDASTSSLTKLGIGRLATSIVANSLQTEIDKLLLASTFNSHPFAKQAITEASESILKELSFDTSDELEICIKPYKLRISVTDGEWAKGRENAGKLLKEELKTCEEAYKAVEGEVGGRKKLKDVVAFIDRVRKGDVVLEGDGSGGAGGFSSALLRKGRDAVFLRDRSDILKMRLAAVRSKQCANAKNKYYCPEVFLDTVADKLSSTADLFLDAELLSKFFYLFPRELDTRLGRGLSAADVERFAREDPKVRRHIDLVKRKDLLEHVLKEIESLRLLEDRERRNSSRSQSQGEKNGTWRFF